MNTAKIKPEFQEFQEYSYDHVKYNHYTLRRKIVSKTVTLDDTYKIIDVKKVSGVTYYLLQTPTGPLYYSKTQLYDINFKSYSIEEIEEELLDKQFLMFSSYRHKATPTLEKFLIHAICGLNVKHSTLYADSKKVQTRPNKRRSLGDWFRICKYYYPDCTLADVATLLYITYPNNRQVYDTYRSSYCSAINKRVFYHNGYSASIYNKPQKDEYNKTWEEWVNQISN